MLLLMYACTAHAMTRISAPEEYGRVVINNYSEKAGTAPVVFQHWLHRARFTCRLCHVDIGFAMEAGATNITADNNAKGFFCGACHNGKMDYNGKKVFASCSDEFTMEEGARCGKCHSLGREKEVKLDYEYYKFTEKFPKNRQGNMVDWEQAEADGTIKPIDYLEGVSIKRPSMKPQEDFSIKSHGTWMTDVIFSHKKHAVWNGCEVCHPEIFPSVKKGDVKYSMFEIFEGRYCGACHDKVAFPLLECQKCHTKPVQ
jgi:c(7)-type cytochrome triheme protein